jgi:hypothetical protein
VLVRQELAEGFFGWLSYTLMRAERKNDDAAPWRTFDLDQTHVLTALLSYKFSFGLEVGVRARFATGFPRSQISGRYWDARRDESATLDLSAELERLRLPAPAARALAGAFDEARAVSASLSEREIRGAVWRLGVSAEGLREMGRACVSMGEALRGPIRCRRGPALVLADVE